MISRKRKKGQSTLEYIILVVAVVAVIVGFVASKDGIFQTSLNTTLVDGTTGMTQMSAHITNTWK